VRHGLRVLDVDARVAVPLGRVEILGQEHRVVDAELAHRRGAEIAHEDHDCVLPPTVTTIATLKL
jgi:hypothetical protein